MLDKFVGIELPQSFNIFEHLVVPGMEIGARKTVLISWLGSQGGRYKIRQVVSVGIKW